MDSREQAATVDAVPGAVTTPPTPYADTRNWEDFTPHVALEHRRDFGLVYLSYSRGFKGGGYSYPAPLNPVLSPETMDSYEIGFKSDLADDRLRLSSALFFYDLKDLQVSRNFGGAIQHHGERRGRPCARSGGRCRDAGN